MRTRRHNQGLTLLETVFAVVIMSFIAASLFSTTDYLFSRQVAQERKLAAMELANRLMLQHLDDPKELEDDRSRPLRYHEGPGADMFRWEMEISEVDIELDDATDTLDADDLRFRDRKLEYVTIRVWLSEHTGGSFRPHNSPVVVELSRLVDPTAMRTPEQVYKFFNDLERVEEIFGR